MAMNFPVPAAVGEEFVDPSGITYVWNGYGWAMKGSAAPPVGDFVLKTGDTMSGNLEINKADAALALDKTSGNSSVWFNSSDVPRWVLHGANSDAESGSDTGSNFALTRFNDAGTENAIPALFIDRSNSAVVLQTAVTINSPIDTGAMLAFHHNAQHRWTIGPNEESLGSDFIISGRDNAGVSKSPVSINRITGDTSFWYDVWISSANDPQLVLNKPVGKSNFITGLNNGAHRWQINLGDPAPETGSNSGSDFVISRYPDAGVSAIDVPFQIFRNSGICSILHSPTAFNHIANKGYVDGVSAILPNGYVKLPSGVILQWGTGLNIGDQWVTFPTAFPTFAAAVTVTMNTVAVSPPATETYSCSTGSVTGWSFYASPRVSFSGGTTQMSTAPFLWFAIGW